MPLQPIGLTGPLSIPPTPVPDIGQQVAPLAQADTDADASLDTGTDGQSNAGSGGTGEPFVPPVPATELIAALARSDAAHAAETMRTGRLVPAEAFQPLTEAALPGSVDHRS